MFRSSRISALLVFALSLSFTLCTGRAAFGDTLPAGSVAGDFNGDGRLDVLVQPADATHPGRIVLRDGTGAMSVQVQVIDASFLGLDWVQSDSVAHTGDFDGDGRADVLLQSKQNGGIQAILLTDPTSQLTAIAQKIPANYMGLDWSAAAHQLIIGDFNGDGHSDVLLQAVNSSDVNLVVSANSHGRLNTTGQGWMQDYLGRDWSANDVRIFGGDFNGDGKTDLLLQTRAGHSVTGRSDYALISADADGRFTQVSQTWNAKDLGADWSPATHTLAVRDINGDGIADIVLMASDGQGSNYAFLGNSSGVFNKPAATWKGNMSAEEALRHAGSTPHSTTSVTGTSAATTPQTNMMMAATTTSTTLATNFTTPSLIGNMAGSPGVSGGAATYTIPIPVPPGRAGMQPSVSLTYSSRGGNGALGMGWSLSAGSEISRCPATQSQDDMSSGVNYSSTDKLCLDGQRLIKVSGTYGQSGSVYRTETESFVKVTLTTGSINSTTSPAQFVAQQKNGNTAYYGYGSDAPNSSATIFNAHNLQKALAWGMGREEDQSGNSIIYHYWSPGNGEYLLGMISYTGMRTTPGNRYVAFDYTTRKDVSTSWLAGGLTDQTQILQDVRTSSDGSTQVLEYDIEYDTSAATGRSLLKGVQKCGYHKALGTQYPACLQPTTFNWHAPTLGFTAPTHFSLPDFDFSGDGWQTPKPSLKAYGDINGDGREDLFYARPGVGLKILLTNPNGGEPTPVDVPSAFTQMTQTPADVDGDGAVDLIGEDSTANANGSHLAYSKWQGSAAGFSTPIALNVDTGSNGKFSDIQAVTDINGDGKPDFVTIESNPNSVSGKSVYYYLHAPDSATMYESRSWMYDLPNFTNLDDGEVLPAFLGSAGDMDGDGLPDFFIIGYGGQVLGVLFTDENSSGTISFPYKAYGNDLKLASDASNVGMNGSAPSWPSGIFMDINGDGLPDYVFDCGSSLDWCYQINTGNEFTDEEDTGVKDTRSSGIGVTATLQGDMDNNGTTELLYPSLLIDEYCEWDGTGTNEVDYTCATSGPGTKRLSPGRDLSIYRYSILKFSPVAAADAKDGSGIKYVPSVSNSDIVAQANLSVVEDIDGDGLSSVISPFTKWWVYGSFAIWKNGSLTYGNKCPDPYPCGISISRNSNWNGSNQSKNAASDIMTGVTDDFGVQSTWDYYPLSSSQSFNGQPLYYAPTLDNSDRYTTGSDYFYFTSSMYVVGAYHETNDMGTTNTDDFHYGEAIYNPGGRGFQGFRTVVDENLATSLRSIQIYHQQYPLSGELEQSLETSLSAPFSLANPAAATDIIERVVNDWQCWYGVGQNAKPLSVTETEFDGSTSTTTCTPTLDAPTYFAYLNETTKSEFDAKSYSQYSTSSTSYKYDMYGNTLSAANTTIDGSGTYAHTVDYGYDSPDLPNWWVNKLLTKTVTDDVTYADGAKVPEMVVDTEWPSSYYNSRRLPKRKTVLKNNADLNILTDYAYDSYGNTTDIYISGGNVADHTDVALRHTYTDYDPEGYFPISVIDPAGLTTSTTLDPATGEPTNVTALDGVVTSYTYDPLGRRLSAQVSSATTTLPVEAITYTVTATGCPSNTALAISTTRTGYPGKTACQDMFGQTVRTITDGFDASKPTYMDVEYDNRGRVTQQSVPYFSGQTEQWDTFAYDDPLGRLTQKNEAKGVQADYSYDGLTNTVTVTQSRGNTTPRTTVETHSSLGKLMNTVDAQGHETDFRYDAHGNPVSITDANGNKITTSYNMLDQKTDVNDPDQGHSSFVYNVLDELRVQTDANGNIITQDYDSDGRMTSRSRSDGVSAAWVYDSCPNGAGKLCSDSQSDGYAEDYTYDDLGRVTNLDNTIDGADHVTSTTYDDDGRVLTISYPELSGVDAIPTAKAGVDQTVALPIVGSVTINLDGSASSNPTDKLGALRYHWTQTAGPTDGQLSGATMATPSFSATSVGVYTFQLTVNNDVADAKATVSITVTPAKVSSLDVASTKSTDGVYAGSTMLSTTGAYNLAWTASVNGADSFKVLQAIGSGSYVHVSPDPAGNSDSFVGMGSETENLTYNYEVVACDSTTGICGPPSDPASIIVELPPGPPASISLPNQSNWDGSFTVGWGIAAGLVSDYHAQIGKWDSEMQRYDWLYAHCGGAPVDRSCQIPAGALSDGVFAGHVYACNDRSCGSDVIASNDITVNIIPPPAAPSLSGPSSTLNGSVALSWSAPADATSYKLYAQYYSQSAGAWGTYALKYSGSARSSSQSLTGDQKYAHYYVAACDQAGCSGPGNTLTVTYVNPAAPTLSAPASTSNGSVYLSWTIPSGATSYQLYGAYQSRTTSAWGAYSVIYSGSASSHTDTMGTMKAAASYYVKACNAPGCGSASSAKTVSYDLAGGTGGCKYCSPTVSTQSAQQTPATGTMPVPASTALPPAATDNAAPPAGSNSANPVPADSVNADTGADTPPPPPPASNAATPPSDGGPLALRDEARGAAPTNAVASLTGKGKLHEVPRSFTFAPPVYQYYADAQIKPASIRTGVAQFIVQYEYTDTGYLSKIVNARDTSELYWQATATDARGQVSAEAFGNGIQSVRNYDAASGYLKSITSGVGGGSGVQNLSYVWEPLGNLSNRNDVNRGLNESFSYDTLNRLIGSVLTNGSSPQLNSYSYDAIGNITCKSDVVMHDCVADPTGYAYGNGAGPHAVTDINGVNYASYDADGNMTHRNGTVINWNADNLPTSISKDANNTSAFDYAPDKHRYYQSALVNGVTETTVYVGNMEIVTRNGATDYRQRISAYGRDVGEYIVSTDANHDQMTYILTDHLGSVDVVTDSTGTAISGTGWSSGAFGKRRDAETWSGSDPSEVTADRNITNRGFTNHEMLDNVDLIHMNGRVYDPNLGRFLSVDPVFQFPTNTQSLNPYSYVLNNPLSLTDPTGYESNDSVNTCSTGSDKTCLKPGLNNVTDKSGKVIGSIYVAKPGQEVQVTNSITGQSSVVKAATGNSMAAYMSNGAETIEGTLSAQNKPKDETSIGSASNRRTDNSQSGLAPLPSLDSPIILEQMIALNQNLSPPPQNYATTDNVNALASIITSEAGSARISDSSKQAVGSTVLNRMRRDDAASVKDVWGAYAHGRNPTQEAIQMAFKLLSGSMSDNTHGATHFYSPISMPRKGDNTDGYDVGGGLEQMPGLKSPNYSPSWSKTYPEEFVPGVNRTYFKFYREPGDSSVQ